MKIEIKEIEIELECCNGDCGSNDFVTLDDPYNQDLFNTLLPSSNEGWLFKMDSAWKQSYLNRPKTINRDLLCFCSEDCYKEWLKAEEFEETDFCDAIEYLKHFEVQFDDPVLTR